MRKFQVIHPEEAIKKADSLQEELNRVKKLFKKELLEQSRKKELPVVEEQDQKAKILPAEYNFTRKLKKIDRIKDRFKPTLSFLVTMLFSNGTERTFCIVTKEEIFYYKGRGYYLRKKDSHYDVSSNRYKLYYYEDQVCPISKDVRLEEESGAVDPQAFFYVTPHNIKPVIRMEYVRAIASATELSKYLKLALLFSVLAFLAAAVSAVILIRPMVRL